MKKLFLVGLMSFGFAACTGEEADKSTDTDTDAADTDTDAVAGVDGARVYADACAVCHAADGTGLSGPDLNSVVPGVDEATLEDVITNGIGGMPAISLLDDELDALVDYVLGEWG